MVNWELVNMKTQKGIMEGVPEGLASMTYRDIGALPGSPLVQCIVRAEP